MLHFKINSEVLPLKAVLIHEPGPEVENMTPDIAERALYSDILNLAVARDEYNEFREVLGKVTEVFELKDILKEIIRDEKARNELISDLADYASLPALRDHLHSLSCEELASQIIEGIPYPGLSLSNYLNKEKYLINPLHNALYTRDTSFIIGNSAYIGRMAKAVRIPETILTKNIFRFYQKFNGKTVDLNKEENFRKDGCTIEGGDLLVFSEEVILVGIGSRTSASAVDELVQVLSRESDLKYVLVQELPEKPESFIHLDMVFTLLSHDECLIYNPQVLEDKKYHTVLMTIDSGNVKKIEYAGSLLKGLSSIGYELKPINCGGSEKRYQEREQWHSGANVLAFSPGKVIGYRRNIHTAEELSKHGYNVISAQEFLKGDYSDQGSKLLVTVEGSELSRGGGGARCMSMPLRRE